MRGICKDFKKSDTEKKNCLISHLIPFILQLLLIDTIKTYKFLLKDNSIKKDSETFDAKHSILEYRYHAEDILGWLRNFRKIEEHKPIATPTTKFINVELLLQGDALEN